MSIRRIGTGLTAAAVVAFAVSFSLPAKAFIYPNAVLSQGKYPQGQGTQGKTGQGERPQGKTAQGSKPQGLYAQGLFPQETLGDDLRGFEIVDFELPQN